MPPATRQTAPDNDQSIAALLREMTLPEKIGQMSQINGAGGAVTDELRHAIAAGQVGSVINEVDAATANELQRIATDDSRLGIPLLMGRDVIHGFRTTFPYSAGPGRELEPRTGATCRSYRGCRSSRSRC